MGQCPSCLKLHLLLWCEEIQIRNRIQNAKCGSWCCIWCVPYLWAGLTDPMLILILCWSFVPYASAVTLPSACSSDRGWCGMGPPSRKYKPLSVCCLDDRARGGPGIPCSRHVPHPPTFNLAYFLTTLLYIERLCALCLAKCCSWSGTTAWAVLHVEAAVNGDTRSVFGLMFFIFHSNSSAGDSRYSAATAWPLLTTSKLSMGVHMGGGGMAYSGVEPEYQPSEQAF